MGNVAMTMIDNPTQQLQWSLVVKGEGRPYIFGGVQPFYSHWIGHSPYTQTLQKENSLLVVTAPTSEVETKLTSISIQNRQKFGATTLESVPTSLLESISTTANYLNNAKFSSATWLFIPKAAQIETTDNQQFFISCGEAIISVKSLGEAYYIEITDALLAKINDKRLKARLEHLNILACAPNENGFSGYALEVFGKDKVKTIDSLKETFNGKLIQNKNRIDYQSYNGNLIQMQYQPQGLRAQGSINSKSIDYDNWADGGVYKSPYISLKNGLLKINDGKEGYSISWKDNLPVYKLLKIR